MEEHYRREWCKSQHASKRVGGYEGGLRTVDPRALAS